MFPRRLVGCKAGTPRRPTARHAGRPLPGCMLCWCTPPACCGVQRATPRAGGSGVRCREPSRAYVSVMQWNSACNRLVLIVQQETARRGHWQSWLCARPRLWRCAVEAHLQLATAARSGTRCLRLGVESGDIVSEWTCGWLCLPVHRPTAAAPSPEPAGPLDCPSHIRAHPPAHRHTPFHSLSATRW